MSRVTEEANFHYAMTIDCILKHGDEISARGHSSLSHPWVLPIDFGRTPLVTWRKTAWKKAIREMEWFLSGDIKCPDDLLDWWDGQLDPDGDYQAGYGSQLRYFSGLFSEFDQIAFIRDALRSNPSSRRLVMTTWHPYDMAHITEINENPRTPTCCHSTIVQFFVRKGELNMTSYQRSADMLLGVPHNWIQSWAMLLWFAHHAGLKVGHMRWLFGDAHIYTDPSHMEVAKQIAKEYWKETPECSAELVYEPPEGVTEFRAEDFRMEGNIPEPVVTGRPALLA